MKKLATLFFFLFLLFNSQNLHAQYEIFGGGNINHYSYNPHSGSYKAHESKGSKLKLGYSIGSSYAFETKKTPYSFSIELLLNNYKNEFMYSNGGQGGDVSNTFTNDIITLDLGLNMINLPLFWKVNLNLGLRTSILLEQKYTGEYKFHIYGTEPFLTDVSDRIEKEIFNMGFVVQLHFGEFSLGDKIYIRPYFSCFVFNENFKSFDNVTSVQNSFGIAIGLNKKELEHISINQ